MNQNIPNQPVGAMPSMWMEDEIDLREYIAVLIKYWRWIVAASVLAAVIAFVVSSFLPRTYEATASVIILKSKTEVSFDPKIQTTVDDQSTQKDYQSTLVGLVTSGEVAGTVFEQNRNMLPPKIQNVADLLKRVDGSNTGDIITITVSDTDPVRAAQLADAWAETYVSYVNQLYGNQTTPLLVEVQSQATKAEHAYKSAQAKLEDFLKDNRISALQREIAVRQGHAKSLLNEKYNLLAQIDSWMDDALSIRLHVASGKTTAGDALAFFMLQRRALARSADAGSQLQLQVSPADFSGASVTVGDVDGLIDTLQKRREEIGQEIQAMENASSDQNTAVSSTGTELESYIAAIDAEVAALQSELEYQTARKKELQQTRDLAWDNFTTLQRKQAELQLSSQISDSQVRLAAGALVPDKPVSPKRMMNTAIAGVLALMLSVFVVFAWEYWRNDDEPVEPSKSQ